MSNTVTLVIIVAIVFLSLSTFITVFVIVYQRRQLNYKRSTEQLKSDFKNSLLQTQLEIQEQTFKNISQEIHDNIGQVMSLVKLNINTLENSSPGAFAEKIAVTKELISKALQDLRDLSKSLNTDYISEMGLVRSVEYELDLIRKTGNYEIQFVQLGKSYRLDAQKELIIFRIVQEALNNIIKHAKATLISVEMNFDPVTFTLKASDNGKGLENVFTVNTGDSPKGIGIRNMYNRAALINSEIKLISNLNKGLTVELKVPV